MTIHWVQPALLNGHLGCETEASNGGELSSSHKADCFKCLHRGQQRSRGPQRQEAQGWREIHAAVALTSLAQGQTCSAPVPNAATGRSCTLESSTASRPAATDGMRITRPASALRPTTGTTLTNRIIQKSCHISEVQTVKVALANTG